jgi:hypothetical protein
MAIAISGASNVATQVLGSNRMMAGRVSELTLLDGQIASSLPIYGRILGWERVGERRIGNSLVLRRYIVRHEHMLTVWYLTYIRPQNSWQVAGINFNDQLQSLVSDW